MRKKNCIIFKITSIILITFFLNCITVPEKPFSDSDQCLSYFFQVRRETRIVKDRILFIHSMVGIFSFSLTMFGGMQFALGFLLIPINEQYYKWKTDKIISHWEKNYCE